jgi:hypothetical protein
MHLVIILRKDTFILQRPMQAFVRNKSRLLRIGLVQGAAGPCSVQYLAARCKEDSAYVSEITESASSSESGYWRSPLVTACNLSGSV